MTNSDPRPDTVGGEAPWIVGRGDGGCYIENDFPMSIGGVRLGEAQFDTEVEALRWAVLCEEDAIRPLKANLRHLKARLRRAEKRATNPKEAPRG
jgi:hypothetical protein